MKIDWSKTTVRLTKNESGRSRWSRGIISLEGWDPVINTNHDLWYVFEGRGYIETGSGRFNLQNGSLIWMRPGRKYKIAQEPDNPLGMNFIHFDLINADGSVRPGNKPCPPELLYPLDVRLVEVVTNRIVELVPWSAFPHPAPLPMAREIATQLFEGLLKHLDAEGELPASEGTDNTRRRHRDIVLSVAAILRDNPATPPAIPELARQAGYSKEHFSRIFKAVTGRSPETFIIEVRLARAKEWLADDRKTIKEIASQLGYRNDYFFSRQFKEKTGMSPTEFRSLPHL